MHTHIRICIYAYMYITHIYVYASMHMYIHIYRYPSIYNTCIYADIEADTEDKAHDLETETDEKGFTGDVLALHV